MRIDLPHASPDSPGRAVAALARGLARHGIDARPVPPDAVEADVVAIWGWRPARPFVAAGKRVLVLERGFVGDRERWVACGWDGLAGRGRYADIDDQGDRWAVNFDRLLLPPRPAGGQALILGQVPGDAAVAGVRLFDWYRSARDSLRRIGYAVGYRAHPAAAVDDGPAACWRDTSRTIAEALAPISLAAAWNSNGLTDAVLAGVPVIAGDAGAMAWPIAAHGFGRGPAGWFGQDFEAARRGWCARLAWCQFTHDDLESGDAWDAVRQVMLGGGWRPAGAIDG